jgi:16S rRNA processing protein RimM
MARPEWIEVGRVRRPHGLRGEVSVAADSDNPERFTVGSVVHARPGRMGLAGAGCSERIRLTMETVRGGAKLPIVAFGEIRTREEAEALRGYLLEVPAVDLPPLDEDEFYPFDLVDLTVEDPQGTRLGRVTQVLDSPAHGLLEIALEAGGKVLVPFVSAAFPDIFLDRGCLVLEPRFLKEGGA